ncbi:MAG: DNA mismatch repair endonuclease MutL [Armatimonadota bacterium]|nr:DNA mismatch repair endonuclease MutL [Armatimonadota bacterium]
MTPVEPASGPPSAVDRIRILDPSVADRIAAGEVVERPASVVKELVENSLDAGATRVVIEVEAAGLNLIRVADDGGGMHPDDVPLAVRRFATSKISSADDLAAIRSFGFRGEALPSIAAVSLLEIVSAPPGGTLGRRLRVRGGEIEADEPASAPAGTVVTVRHLFYNTPARRKFLRSPAREFALIVEAVDRLALACPQVGFRLIHAGAEVRRFPPASPADRLAAVVGAQEAGGMVAVAEEGGGLRVWGWAGRPEMAQGTRRLQYLYVNRRPIHSRALTAAVEEAYRQLVPAGRHPPFVLFVDVPPERVDVNVHPRKAEVRFADERAVCAAAFRAVQGALRTQILIPAVGSRGWDVPGAVAEPGDLPIAAGTAAVTPAVEIPAAGRLPALRLVGQLHRTYLLAEGPEGLVIVDQHAAHERVLYERLLDRRRAGMATGQGIVPPAVVELRPEQAALLRACADALAGMGWVLDEFGEATVLVRAVPAIAARLAPGRLLADLLAEVGAGDRLRAGEDILERLTIATACRSAVRAGDALSVEEMASLLADLARTRDPFTCFHGRPTLIMVPRARLESWFLRR